MRKNQKGSNKAKEILQQIGFDEVTELSMKDLLAGFDVIYIEEELNGSDGVIIRGKSKTIIKVDWFYSGIGESGEVTTCSLHTSLAPKMQSNAKNSGIVVGHNVTTQLRKDKYFEQRSKEIHDYEDGRKYHQYNFDWERYLVDNNLAVQNDKGVLVLTINTLPDPNRNSRDLYPIASKSKPYFNYE